MTGRGHHESITPLEDFDRTTLAELAREYFLAAHLIDRAGMPHVVGAYGLDAMRDCAIDEWMGASPVYTRRMRTLLRFSGDDVATIFKGMQFDVGAPHQFMDFRYRVQDHDHGEFWLDSCGALLDVEPMGEEFTVAMCHDIEDPTFDATACASNPRARMRPIHRPPRQPADRHPHCHWTVTIEHDADPIPEPAVAIRVATSRLAATPIPDPDRDTPADAGAVDYADALDPELRMERFSAPVLVALCDESCTQGHMLVLSFGDAVEQRFGVEAARDITRKQGIGVAGVDAIRLKRALDLGSDLASLAAILELHPAFRPRDYFGFSMELDGSDLTVHLGPGPYRRETVGATWASLVTAEDPALLDAIAHAVDPRLHFESVPGSGPDDLAFRAVLGAEARPEVDEVTLTKFSTGVEFVFSD